MPREVLHFDPFANQARRHWAVDATVPREVVPLFLEHLEDLCIPDRGGRFYFPRENGTTHCRFEWSWRSRTWPQLLRLGTMFDVDSNKLGPIEGFVTTNYNVQHPGAELDDLPEAVARTAAQRVNKRLRHALELTTSSSSRTFHHVLYLEWPGGVTVTEDAHVPQGKSKILPAVIVRDRRRGNERISAVIHRVEAPTPQAAQRSAKARHALLCALGTLATHLPFAPYGPRWTKRHPKRDFVESMDEPTARLYPGHIAVPQREETSDFGGILNKLVVAFDALGSGDAELFQQALLAYAGGREVEGKQGTLASVSYVAGLNLLAGEYVAECPGGLSCTTCGSLRWKHKDTGDAAAITKMGIDLLRLDPGAEVAASLKRLVRSVYSAQRSAFVHSAVLRHGEYDQEGVVSCGPGHGGKQFSRLASYALELDSIAHLTRRLLVAWLERRSGQSFDLGRFASGDGIERTRPLDAAIHVSRRQSTMRMVPYRPGELEGLKARWLARKVEGSTPD